MRKKFFRAIVYSKTPFNGQFRFLDYFQLIKCDFPNLPKSEFADLFPLVLESWVDLDQPRIAHKTLRDEDDIIHGLMLQKVHTERLLDFLSVVTNFRFQTPLHDISGKWGTNFPPARDNREFDKYMGPSQWFVPMFRYDGMDQDLTIADYSSHLYPGIALVPFKEYYLNDPVESRDKSVDFPDTITMLLNNYYAFGQDEKDIIRKVSHLICNGLDLMKSMKSLSFISFVSAIETLVNYDHRDEEGKHCKCCGQQIFSVNKKFINFLKTYVSPNEEGKFKKIYSLRSSIAHRGMLLVADEQIDWEETDQSNAQYITRIEAMQCARIALANWMLMGGKRSIQSV